MCIMKHNFQNGEFGYALVFDIYTMQHTYKLFCPVFNGNEAQHIMRTEEIFPNCIKKNKNVDSEKKKELDFVY